MRIYWSLKSIPELGEMAKNDRKIIWRQCYFKAFQNWQTWIALAICGGCAGLGTVIGYTISDTIIVCIISAGIGGGIGGFIFGQVATKMARRYIREYLNSREEMSRA